ncbi:FecR family protein [Kordia sp.]|uniref:FecR family protein n=1 Tax=Kordia sp. TaxID=1965332 RepID=UPI0025B92AC7|nr:FecR family protein [Kordia sp.]MCH2193610.1 FecR family protein [Kordia sp.]
MTNYKALIKKLAENNISSTEKRKLEEWVLSNDENLKIFSDTYKEYQKNIHNAFDTDAAFKKFKSSITTKDSKVFKLSTFYKYAAVLIILISLGYFLFDNSSTANLETIVKTNTDVSTDNNSGTYITIKLADGSKRVITSNSDEDLKDASGNIIANNSDKGLRFKNDLKTKELVYNEIYIPNGKIFKLELSDGTTVWLNAGTRFKFPQNFTQQTNNRTVYLDGEAYFDVTKNKDKSFIVHTKDINVEVLGTQFNVSSYANEAAVSTTLVEGSVNVFSNTSQETKMQLRPNFQAKYSKVDRHLSKVEVNTEIYTSWINNKLIINNLKFHEILKKLERKYDISITNKVHKLNNEIYTGEFENETIETILETISLSTTFNYTIHGNKIIITK